MSAEQDDVFVGPTVSEIMLNAMSHSVKSATPDVSRHSKSRPVSPQAGTSYEVFRNNTTAVEVIVKEVPNRKKRTKGTVEANHNHVINDRDKINKLRQDIDNLKIDLNTANTKLILTRKGFSDLVIELQKQLETVNKREMEEQIVNMKLQMENEKLKAQLESKSKLVKRLTKEFASMQRLLKFVVKGMRYTPNAENYTLNSDAEYDDFEKGLKNENHVRFTNNLFDFMGGNVTFDSSVSKNMNSF